ncbi:MAG: 3-phosphoshikimate 1-carboxyvinyltransferase [Deltaproteobacteria bacterium RBG_13_52_11b]|nr:MAG: 3-phosphoshikimate 1-carboxyvinyltransferase [Deltaproteobacteria bacterium RBG_13_52_11b]
MKIVSEKSVLRGEVLIPTSKSHTVRAVTLSTLAHGKSTIRHPLVSSDCLAAVGAGRLFGAKVSLGDVWEVEGVNGAPCIPENVVDVKNSGTTLYFFMGTAALAKGATVLTGDDQIIKRPAQPLITALSDLGAEVFSTRNNGLPPVVVKGPAKGGKARVGGLVSQYISSLLIHCPLMEKDSKLEVFDLHEKPYVQMTLSWLDRYGIRYKASDDFAQITIYGGQSYQGLDVTVPGDFSSGTFFLVAGSIGEADITLLGLDMNDAQGDKQVVTYLQEMGARISQEKGRIRVRGGALKGREFDLGDTPDALPAMAVAGCFAQGKTILRNVANARLKETDRIAVMAKELGTLGAKVEELPDGLVIHESKLRGRPVCGHRDHRVVMALAVAGTAIPGHLEVDSAEAVQVTFPNFLELMKGLGAKIREQE